MKKRLQHFISINALCLGVFVLLVAHSVHADPATDRLNAFFAERGVIRADFVQTVQGAAFAQPEESRGKLVMQRPGKFRWDYTQPYEQQIVADGKQLWIYDVDLEQVVVKPLDTALGDTPALLLSGDAAVAERFDISQLKDRNDGLLWLALKPKRTDTGYNVVRLGFGPKHLRSMELVDGFDQLTQLDFANVEVGANVPAETFVFEPPKGVDVIGKGQQ